MAWIDFLIIGFLAGTSFGLVLIMLVITIIEKMFEREKSQFKSQFKWREITPKEMYKGIDKDAK
ncbi:hypothetical protein [Bacillus wiedmannii]|uniref:hypothetical protein n=1 Tax=Bacillus wiedmannii TaxID=1890302 RepID=UPI0025A1C9D0|nr:hypothetical protein [Bacillus wiedmannii]MDM5270529.1 hypothetical protein [Bacillus wiedmannii]